MNKIIENFLVPLFFVISVLYVFNSFSYDSIQLNKIYHHKGHDPKLLERANISLYFSHNPHIECTNATKNRGCKLSFFFPRASIAQGECELMLKSLTNQYDGYKISVKEIYKSVKGLEFTFDLDPEQCVLRYEKFDSIGLQKGIVFRLYNKNVLRTIESNNEQPVLRTLWHTQKPCVAIDFGHGGTDAGAIGCGGIREKDICLAIGTMVCGLLEQQGFSTVLTRKDDSTVPLDQRTAYVNDSNADLFVSIHANYAANPRACGVETFCMSSGLLKQCFSQLSDTEDKAVGNLMHERCTISNQLAHAVQKNVCYNIAPFHEASIDRKVKHAVSQVLLSTQKPSVLVEVGFISHKKEAELLGYQEYQKTIAHGICNGIISVVESSFSL